MAADHPGPDPKSLWKDQDQETDPMSLERVRALVRTHDRRTQFVPLMVGVCLVVVGLLGGSLWASAHDTLDRVSAIFFILGEAGAFIIGYRVAVPRRDFAESAGAYLRRRLQLKLAHARGRWMVMLAPLLPFFLLSFYRATKHPPPHGSRLLQIAPLAVLMALWLVVFLVQKRMKAPGTKAQLDELDALMRR